MGRLLVSDTKNNCIKIFDSSGTFLTKLGSEGSRCPDLSQPHGICVDVKNNILVADCKNHRVNLYCSSGEFIEHVVCETEGITGPSGLAIYNNKLLVTRCNRQHPQITMCTLSTEDMQSQVFETEL